MKHSIRIKFTLIFVGIMALTIGACLLINGLFLENFYLREKQTILMQAYEDINTALSSKDENESEQVENMLRTLRDSNNVSAVVLDSGNEILYYSTADTKGMLEKLRLYLFSDNLQESNGSWLKKQVYSTETYNIILIEDQNFQTTYMECWGFFDNNILFLLSLPVESIQESVAVSNRFYLLVGALAVLISGFVMFFMTKRMTRPIKELSALSEEMAGLNFQVRYNSGAQDEVGVLGSSMNHLADALEKTIRELKEANEQLKRDIDEKVQIDDMRKEFLSNVSHELKTPIAIIQGYAEGLRDGVNEDEESRNYYCDVLIDEAQKMNQIVQKLLELNQLEFGNSDVEMEIFDIMALIQGVVHASEILVRQKEGTILLPQGEPVYVTADEFMIEEILKNYLSNAINHLDGEKRIEIKLQQKGDQLKVSVFNTGQNIPEEDLENVWIKFFKVDKARTREYGGSGIGLSIVKAIADKHHQQCGVCNHEDGVEFWFTLKVVNSVENPGSDCYYSVDDENLKA